MSDFDKAILEARRLASTPDGQKLISHLQSMGGIDLQQAVNQAAAGDFRQAQQALAALMQDPQARKIMEQLGGNHGK